MIADRRGENGSMYVVVEVDENGEVVPDGGAIADASVTAVTAGDGGEGVGNDDDGEVCGQECVQFSCFAIAEDGGPVPPKQLSKSLNGK